jgi:hypothetical protein
VVEGWGNVALATGDGAAAERAFREALEREPGRGRPYVGLAAALNGWVARRPGAGAPRARRRPHDVPQLQAVRPAVP